MNFLHNVISGTYNNHNKSHSQSFENNCPSLTCSSLFTFHKVWSKTQPFNSAPCDVTNGSLTTLMLVKPSEVFLLSHCPLLNSQNIQQSIQF